MDGKRVCGILLIVAFVAGATGRGYARDGVVRTSDRLAAEETLAQPEFVVLSNGLEVRLFDAGVMMARLSELDGIPILQLDATRYVNVVTDINDPDIYNHGDGSFHPFDRDHVLATLAAITHPNVSISMTVYILPYPRRDAMVSSTSGAELFLSPHVLDIDPAVSAYITTHEFGHVLHNTYVPEGSALWDEYRTVRGITDETRYNASAQHAYRPREIFAEDFRVLFGDEEAQFDGRIENTELQSPLFVAGLKSFFSKLGSEGTADRRIFATAYPNPFNPLTNVTIALPLELSDNDLRVRVYDVRGRLVRRLHDGPAGGALVSIEWDGTDDYGNRVASSNYFAVVESGGYRSTFKLMLLK